MTLCTNIFILLSFVHCSLCAVRFNASRPLNLNANVALTKHVFSEELFLSLAFYQDSQIHVLKTLIISIANNVPTANLVLFVEKVPSQVDPVLHHRAVKYVVVTDYPKDIDMFFLRQWLYGAFLKIINSKAFVLIVDGRDTVVQISPWRYMPRGDYLYFFSESATHVIRDNVNVEWITMCYGHEAAAHLGGLRIVNAGTIWGRGHYITHYADVMLKEVEKLRQLNRTKCIMNRGCDQGIHNWMIYTGMLKPVQFRLESNEFGRIFSGDDAKGMQVRGNCLLRNLLGQAYVALHQWDRTEESQHLVHSCFRALRSTEGSHEP